MARATDVLSLALMLSLSLSPAHSLALLPFDPLSGVISFSFDVIKFTPDGYVLNVNAHSGSPRCSKLAGWILSWTFPAGEFLWAVTGAYPQDKGSCDKVFPAGGGTPYCCAKSPTFMDNRDPGTTGKLSLQKAAAGCEANPCAIYIQTVKMIVGNASNKVAGFRRPFNYTLPGYKCSLPVGVAVVPTKCKIQSLVAWRVDCAPIPAKVEKVEP